MIFLEVELQLDSYVLLNLAILLETKHVFLFCSVWMFFALAPTGSRQLVRL